MLQRALRPTFVCAALVAAAMAGPAVAETESPSLGLVRQHELGLGYQGITFGTEAGDRYVLHGPALAYQYVRGCRWGGMVRLSGARLVAGRMTGPSGEFRGGLGDVYDQRRYAADLMLMGVRRVPLGPHLVVTAAAGVHVNGFTLTGTRYSPVENISVGLGSVGKLDYPLNRWLAVSGNLTVGLHPFDLVDHRNPAGWVIPFSTTVTLAARH